MSAGQVLFAIATLAFGGFSSVLLKSYLDRRQGSIRTLEKRVQITPINLHLAGSLAPSKAVITIPTPSGEPFTVERLYIVRVEIENTTKDKDFDAFKMAISYPHNVLVLDEHVEKPDPNYTVESCRSPESPKDFTDADGWSEFRASTEPHRREYQLYPFNRQQVYTFHFTIAPIRVRYSEKPDDAGGSLATATFNSSFVRVKKSDVQASALMSGVTLTEPVRRLRTYHPITYVQLLSAILVFLFYFPLAYILIHEYPRMTGGSTQTWQPSIIAILIVVLMEVIVFRANVKALGDS